MFNRVFLIGRLVRDPEMRMTSSGIAVTRFTIAVDRFGKDSGADFIRIVCWRRLAEIANQYMHKGKLVSVDGTLQIDTYEKDGISRESVEVIADNIQMLDRGQPQDMHSSVPEMSAD